MERFREGDDSLIGTKFLVPHPSYPLIQRPHLITLLHEGVQRKLMLVSAPAGFGKTILLTTWIRSLPADWQVAWVSLDAEDNVPVRFWEYVLSALSNCVPGIARRALYSLRTSLDLSLVQIVQMLIEDCAALTHPVALILDDYHLITSPEMHDSLAFLLEHLPPHLHIILLTRADPPFSLHSLHEQSDVMEIRTNQLRWTVDEIDNYFSRIIGVTLEPSMLHNLVERTEGWIVGLVLLGIAYQHGRSFDTLLDHLSGDSRYMFDYFTEEVLQQQPLSVQRFLLYTSIVDPLCASLCDTIVEVVNSQEVLDYLERINVFVMALDDQRHWYRYHQLFAEALYYCLEQTQSELIPILHQRASHWYAEHNYHTDAIFHAFRARDWRLAIELIHRIPSSSVWGTGKHELAMLQHWLEYLSAKTLHTQPRLSLTCAQTMYQFAGSDILKAWLDSAEANLRAVLDQSTVTLSLEERYEQENLLGEVLLFQAFLISWQSDGYEAFSLCQQALELLSPQNLVARAKVCWVQLHAIYFSSRNDARTALPYGIQAIQFAQEAHNPLVVTQYLSAMTYYLKTCGHLHEGQRYALLAMQQVEASRSLVAASGEPLASERDMPALFYVEILREWNQLDRALELALQNIEVGKRTGAFTLLLCSYSMLIRVYLSRGDIAAARTTFEQYSFIASQSNPFLPLHIGSLYTVIDQVRLWLACGELDRAISWAADGAGGASSLGTPFAYERSAVACVRVLLAQRQPDRALEQLTPLVQRATSAQRWDHVLEMWLLQTMAYQMLGKEKEALETLKKAVRWAQPEGYIRCFVDEGPLIATLLMKLQKQERKRKTSSLGAYLDTLLATFPQRTLVVNDTNTG
jgi:LuxR family transcriptional regulator, maltose regulon positive regulatory protein